MIENPYAEAPRPQAPAVPPSKHRGGRHRKMSETAKRRRARAVKQRIQDYLNSKAVREAVDG